MAAPINGAVAANANVAAPIDAAVGANVGSVGSDADRGLAAGRDHQPGHHRFCRRDVGPGLRHHPVAPDDGSPRLLDGTRRRCGVVASRRGRAPERADGVELIGEMVGSGYRVPPALARRGDGQTFQLTPLLYLVLETVDGARDYERGRPSRSARPTARTVTADNIAHPRRPAAAPDGPAGQGGRLAAGGQEVQPAAGAAASSTPSATRSRRGGSPRRSRGCSTPWSSSP